MDLSNYTQPMIDDILPRLNLSEDEKQIFMLLTKGKTIIQIADNLALSESTVNRRIRKIKDKIDRLESRESEGYMIRLIKDGREIDVSEVALNDKITDLIVSLLSDAANESVDRV